MAHSSLPQRSAVKIRLLFASIAAVACVLLAACHGGGSSPASDTGSGNPTNESLRWDSGQWDNSIWS
jgi:hypothetical protein